MSRLRRTGVGRRLSRFKSTISSGRSVSLFQFFFFLSTSIAQRINPSDSELTLFPSGEEQIVEAGLTLTITCEAPIDHSEPYRSLISNQRLSWEIPDNIKKAMNERLHYADNRNGTHITSTLTLRNTKIEDTGLFKCSTTFATNPLYIPAAFPEFILQYVYVYSNERLLFLEAQLYQELPNLMVTAKLGQDLIVPCKPTHPNVSVSLFQVLNDDETDVFQVFPSLSQTDSDWSFDPRRGFTIKNQKIHLLSKDLYFVCVGILDVINGKRVNVTREKKPQFIATIEKFNLTSEVGLTDLSELKLITTADTEIFILRVIGMELERVDEPNDVVEGTNVTLICRIAAETTQVSSFTSMWYYEINGAMQTVDDKNPPPGIQTTEKARENDNNNETDIITRRVEKRLHLHNVTLDTPYTKFQCSVRNRFNEKISFEIKEINNEPVNNSIALESETAQNLTCNRLSQHVNVQWFKDDTKYTGKVKETEITSVLPLEGKENESGNYKCRWNNSRGEARHRRFIVSFTEAKSFATVNAISITFAVLFAIGVGISIKIYLDKKKLEKAREINLDGDPSRIDPDVPLEYQTEFLPYDKKWEFPRKRLRLGQQLGAGCFGRVVKAEAVGIGGTETVTTVAVKMVKATAQSDDALAALIRELKILIYMGSHVNVVNLLGACTKTNVREELLVIIDYCRFGNIKNYLVQHRDQFINKLNELGDLPSLTEAAETELKESDHFDEGYPPFSTWDLVRWTLQVARGMEFLCSKKVLHGDLAARNVLLADHGIVKVADFGMARKMYGYCYEKKEESLIPIKWMAIESITDHIFSSQSDVWSYGILLWEIFSLGKVPYPGMNGRVLMEDIQNGYRMTPPEYSPNFFAKIMKNCWKKDPKERPTFSQLSEMIKNYVESLASIDYLNTNSSCENCAITEILDPTPTSRLEIVKFFNATRQSADVNCSIGYSEL